MAVAHGDSPPVMPAWAPSRSESFFPWRGPLVQCCEPVSSSADACDTKTRASMRGREAGKRPPRKGRAELWSSEGEGGPAAGASALSVTTRGRCASPRTRLSFPWPRGPHLSPGSCRGPPFPPPLRITWAARTDSQRRLRGPCWLCCRWQTPVGALRRPRTRAAMRVGLWQMDTRRRMPRGAGSRGRPVGPARFAPGATSQTVPMSAVLRSPW